MSIKNYSRFLACLLSLVVLFMSGYAQEYTPWITSSEGSAMIRNIQNPVNHFSGIATVQVPLLHFVGNSSVGLPIYLKYQTSGIRVGDLATNVGLGWQLSAGGKITRVMKGYPDFGISTTPIDAYNHIFNKKAVQIDKGMFFDIEIVPSDDRYKYYNQMDTEPDLFYFEIPGKAGMFVFDNNGNTHTIPYQNISIKLVSSSYFVITDENGTKYTLGEIAKETTSVAFNNNNLKVGNQETISCVTTWHLEKIETINNGKVTLKYGGAGAAVEYDNYLETYEFESHHKRLGISPTGRWDSETREYTVKGKNSHITTNPLTLYSIEDGNDSVSFVTTGRSDLANASKYSEIKLTHGRKLIKTILLDYSKFPNGRLRLDGVREKAGNSFLQVCKFHYNPKTHLPERNSYSQDYWGYYNGKYNTTLRPDINFEYTTNAPYAPYIVFKPAYGGGRSNYTRGSYGEDNVENDSLVSDGYTPGRPRIHVYGNYVRPSVGYTYKYYECDSCLARENVYSTVFNGADRTPSLINAMADILTKIEYPTGGYKEYKYELNDFSICNTNPKNKTTGGLRIKEIISYDQDNRYVTKYAYKCGINDSISSGIAVNDVSSDYFYTCVFIPTSNDRRQGYLKFHVSSQSLYGLYDANSSNVSYHTVIETLPDNTKNVYEYTTALDNECYDLLPGSVMKVTRRGTYANPGGGEEVVESSPWSGGQREYYNLTVMSPRSWMRGILKSVSSYDSSNRLISRSINLYRTGTPKAIIKGSVIAPNTSSDPREVDNTNKLYVYEWASQPIYLDTVIVEKGLYNLPSVTTYKYDTINMVLKNINHTDADGIVTSTIYKYPFDYKFTGSYPAIPTVAALKKLNTDNIIIPIETTIERSGKVIGGSLTEFQILPNSSCPAAIRSYSLVTQNPISNFDYSYISSQDFQKSPLYKLTSSIVCVDSRGIPLTKTDDAARVTSTILGYNGSLCIASVSNAIYCEEDMCRNYYGPINEVYHTSFEDQQSPYIVKTANAKTGESVWDAEIQKYSIPLSHFKPGVYILSYWTSASAGSYWTYVSETLDLTTPKASHFITCSFWIDEVRIIPQKARMTTYTYAPFTGKTSEMDHNGQVRYWEYDSFGRLHKIFDNDRNTIEEHTYNVKHY